MGQTWHNNCEVSHWIWKLPPVSLLSHFPSYTSQTAQQVHQAHHRIQDKTTPPESGTTLNGDSNTPNATVPLAAHCTCLRRVHLNGCHGISKFLLLGFMRKTIVYWLVSLLSNPLSSWFCSMARWDWEQVPGVNERRWIQCVLSPTNSLGTHRLSVTQPNGLLHATLGWFCIPYVADVLNIVKWKGRMIFHPFLSCKCAYMCEKSSHSSSCVI